MTAAPESARSLLSRIDRKDLARLATVTGLAIVDGIVLGLGADWWICLGIAVVGLIVGCWPIVAEALEDIRKRRMSMELSMLLAIAAAALIGEWLTALVITAFVLAAEILEDLSVDRGREALTELMTFLPSRVRVRRSGGVQEADLDDLQVGDQVLVPPGGRVPVDGTVLTGTSCVDASRITGEPLAVDVAPGETVYAGSVNQLGALVVRAEHVGEDSSYGQIVAAVQAAQTSKAPVQRLADRLAGWLVYLALGGAALTWLITRDPVATISVVIVAGACGVAAGTPLAVLAAIARTARSGVFVKDGTHLEELSGVDTIVFDKTGTLTHGRPVVARIDPGAGFTTEDLTGLVASAELYSEHPIAGAILSYARAGGHEIAEPERFEYQPGLGVTAVVNGRSVRVGNANLVPGSKPPAGVGSPLMVAIEDVPAGTIWITDSVRESAADAVAALRRFGLRVVMMTGDNQRTAAAVGAGLGIEEVHANLKPADKLNLIEQLRRSGAQVAMVGDGVNDAPALAKASVGIAMGSGTHIAQETADVVLVSSDLGDLVGAFDVARRARRIVMTNFAGTIAVDLVGMALAATGLLGPIAAALVHVGSESAFILNSARLIPRTGRRGRAPGHAAPDRAELANLP